MSEVKQPSRTNPVRHNNQCIPNDCVCVLGDHWVGSPTVSAPKVGDRVRVVIEDSVYGMGAGGTIGIDAGWFRADLPGVVSIEVIAPLFVLPTKRWAQVSDDAGMLWTRQHLDNDDHREWISIGGSHRDSEEMFGGWAKLPLRVISEGVGDE
jgi:hypothetical protein